MKPQAWDYQTLLQKISKDLKITGRPLEEKIIAYCIDQVGLMSRKAGTMPKTLDQLLVIVAGQLELGIREIHSPNDFELLKQDYPPSREPVIATIPSLLDSDTSAVVLHRPNRPLKISHH